MSIGKKTHLFFGFLGLLLLGNPAVLWSQEQLSMETYLDYVKKYHPFVKQAQLKLRKSEAKLLQKRGAFDPKLSFEQKQKTFKETPYYNQEETRLSIPSYFGLSFEASLKEADGVFLNPENNLNEKPLFGIGASVELGKGLLQNPRQTALKQAKLFTQQAKAENALEISQILTAASHAYLEWYKAYKSYLIFDQFVTNAQFRFEGVKKRMEQGDLAAIDTIEARIAYNQRLLNKENARLDRRKKALLASNYLWVEEQAVLIQEGVAPALNEVRFSNWFKADSLPIENHPKIRALGYKQNQLVLAQRLQRNNLLPQISLRYQWLSENNPLSRINLALDPNNNTTSLKVAFPLFLRKERANVKLAALKLQDFAWEQAQTVVSLQNKIQALYFQKEQLKQQKTIAQAMVKDYGLLFNGEQQKFRAGESTLFLVNARESKLIEALLKAVSLEVSHKKAEISYFYAVNFTAASSINGEEESNSFAFQVRK